MAADQTRQSESALLTASKEHDVAPGVAMPMIGIGLVKDRLRAGLDILDGCLAGV